MGMSSIESYIMFYIIKAKKEGIAIFPTGLGDDSLVEFTDYTGKQINDAAMRLQRKNLVHIRGSFSKQTRVVFLGMDPDKKSTAETPTKPSKTRTIEFGNKKSVPYVQGGVVAEATIDVPATVTEQIELPVEPTEPSAIEKQAKAFQQFLEFKETGKLVFQECELEEVRDYLNKIAELSQRVSYIMGQYLDDS